MLSKDDGTYISIIVWKIVFFLFSNFHKIVIKCNMSCSCAMLLSKYVA